MGCPHPLFLCICPVLAKKLMAPLSPTILQIYLVSSISSWLYWTSSKVGGLGEWEGEESGSLGGERENRENMRRWGPFRGRGWEDEEQIFLSIRCLRQLLRVSSCFCTCHLLALVVSWIIYFPVWPVGSWWRCSLHGWPYYRGACAPLTSPGPGEQLRMG